MDKVTEVDLENINFNMTSKIPAIEWLYCQYGAQSEGLWKLKGLRYVYFKEPKHATHFVLRWA
jgi:hypothetical protein